jgi:hypothetical protein
MKVCQINSHGGGGHYAKSRKVEGSSPHEVDSFQLI